MRSSTSAHAITEFVIQIGCVTVTLVTVGARVLRHVHPVKITANAHVLLVRVSAKKGT